MLGGLLFQVLVGSITAAALYAGWLLLQLQRYRSKGIGTLSLWEICVTNVKLLLRTEHMGDTMDRIYDAHKNEKIVVTSLKPVVLVTDPEIVHTILVKEFSHFHDRGFAIDTETNPLDGNLFMMSGEKWKVLRNKLSPTFTSGKLKDMFPLMTKCGNEFVEDLNEKRQTDFELQDYAGCLTTDVIASCAFGLDTSSLKDPDNEFRKMGKRAVNLTVAENLATFMIFLWPSFVRRLRLRTMAKNVVNFFTSIVKQSFDERMKTGKKRNDFLQLLLELREKGSIALDPKDIEDDEDKAIELETDATLEFTDDLLTAQATVFINAGFETTATTIAYTLYELSKRPAIQEKIRAEVEEVIKAHGELNYNAVRDMKYLSACIDENLRLNPPVRNLFRECVKTFTFENGVTLEKGTSIIIPMTGIQKDPEYFENPLEFIPERFLESKPHPGSYMPFGDGPRICIGQRFALVEVKMVLAKVLRKFKVTLSPKTKEPLVSDKSAFIQKPIGGFFIEFSPVTA